MLRYKLVSPEYGIKKENYVDNSIQQQVAIMISIRNSVLRLEMYSIIQTPNLFLFDRKNISKLTESGYILYFKIILGSGKEDL